MLIYSILVLLLATAVNKNRDSSILFSRITIIALVSSLIVLSINMNIYFVHEGLILYGGLFILKKHMMFFILFILVLSVFIVSINSFFLRNISNTLVENNPSKISSYLNKIRENSIRKLNIMTYEYRIIEYPLIILFCLTGAIFLMCSYDIVSIFLSIELQSYALYLLCSIHRNSESSINAGLTYFLLGGFSSCIILLGISLLYINTGNTSLESIYMINSISNAFTNHLFYENGSIDSITTDIASQYTSLQLPLAIMSVGLLFKIGSAPFHF
jgi:NADH-ubiquinone oxidoreductase chain 2